MPVLDLALPAIALICAAIMLQPRMRDATLWRATVTPLASIIGSGFLVVAPLLAVIAGPGALWAILVIVVLAVWIGSAIRLVIAEEATLRVTGHKWIRHTDRASDIALALAYTISIAFYIRLLSGFVLSGMQISDPFIANLIASSILLFIGIFGWLRGLHGLERLEEYSVTVKLAIIVALMAALTWTDLTTAHFPPLPTPELGWLEQARRLAGMLLIVQGFETSRYLFSEYNAATRRRSMWWAQMIAGLIYVGFVALSLPMMSLLDLSTPNETAIIDLARTITPALPVMLIIAAVMSQFSAAVADTLGAGGVIDTESRQKISTRTAYLVVTLIAIALIWTSNVFELVSHASRAFAVYYLSQCLIATGLSYIARRGRLGYMVAANYAALSVIMILIVLFAVPVGV